MENRRATRGSEPAGRTTRKTNSQSSTTTRPSPSRSGRSPARTSEARKSPARIPPKSSPRSPGRPKKESTADGHSSNKKLSPKVSIAQLTPEKIRTMTSRSATTTTSKMTKSRSSVKVSGDDVSDDYVNRVKDKAQEKRNEVPRLRLSVTRSENSRLSSEPPPSRSVSRSLARDYEDMEPLVYESTQPDSDVQEPLPSVYSKEFGGDFVAFLLICITPILASYLQYACNVKDCKLIGVERPKSLNHYFIYEEIICMNLIYYVTMVLLSCIKRVEESGKKIEYHCNAFVIALLYLVLVVVLEKYFKYPMVLTIHKYSGQFTLSAASTALLFSVLMYIRNKKTEPYISNPYGASGHFFTDFYLGRHITMNGEIYSRIFDFKMALYRISTVTSFIVSSVYVYKSLHFAALPATPLNYVETITYCYTHLTYDLVPLLVSTLTLLYTLDSLWFEKHMLRSFDMEREGTGAHLFLRWAIFPFQLSLMSKFAFINKLEEVPIWACCLMFVLYVTGLFIKRLSCKVKYDYRTNPNGQESKDLIVLYALQEGRIIMDKYWRWVRHPNYLGEIICALSICLPLFWHFAWPPLIVCASTIVLLGHRAHRVNSRLSTRYNWNKYCEKVRYNIVPKLY